MFRVCAFVLVVLGLSLFFGCSDKTSGAKPTGLELGFMNCFTFNAEVYIDNNDVGPFSCERVSFINVEKAGNHTLYARANCVMADSTYSWTKNFSVVEGGTTHVDLNCKIATANNSDVQVDNTMVVANGIPSVQVKVIARDWLGNLAPGNLVKIESTGGPNNITQPVRLTDANGVAVGMVGSTKAELKTISARVQGTLITKTRDVTFSAFSASVSDVRVNKTAVKADGVDEVRVTVTVKNAQGDPLSGSVVKIESTGGPNNITQPVGLTDANGVAVGTVRSTKAEPKTISARADRTLITKTMNVTFVAGAFSAAGLGRAGR